MKMAGVFMFSACTIGLRTAIFARWVAFLGYACALVLVVIANWRWIALVFQIWMLLVSVQILLAEFHSSHAGASGAEHYQLKDESRAQRDSRKWLSRPRGAPRHSTILPARFRSHARCIRTNDDVVDQNRDFADHFRLQCLQIFQLEAPGRQRQNRLIGPREFAFMLVSIGLISLLLATLEHRQSIRALGAQYAGKQRSLAVLVAALISILGILALVAMIFRQ